MSRARWCVVAAMVAVAIVCFVWGDGGSGAERQIFVAMASSGAGHARVARAATALGYFVVLGPVSLLLGVWLAQRRGLAVAAAYLSGTLIARLVVEILKDIARRPRPALLPHLAPTVSWSFPSGHAANSMMVLLGFALLASLPPAPPDRVERSRGTAAAHARLDSARHERWWNEWAVAGAFLLTLAIGASRVLLAVHWPSDVVAGWAIGAAAAILTAAAAERLSRAQS